MNKFADFFNNYMDLSGICPAIKDCEIIHIKMDSQSRSMIIDAQCQDLIDHMDILKTENIIKSSILNLSDCRFMPHYDGELFDLDYYPQLILELKRRCVSLNGTLNDSTVSLDNNRLIVELKHGGKDLLDNQKFDRNLSELIRSEFGISLKVEYSGNG